MFASGGGTGSGLSPYLLGVLVEEFGADEYDPEKRFAAVTILPTDKEPLQPAINSYNCCKELYDVDGLGAIFFLDNNTRDNKFTINDEFVKGLDEILNIPERHKSTNSYDNKLTSSRKEVFEAPRNSANGEPVNNFNINGLPKVGTYLFPGDTVVYKKISDSSVRENIKRSHNRYNAMILFAYQKVHRKHFFVRSRPLGYTIGLELSLKIIISL